MFNLNRKKTYKDIEDSRNRRLWVTEVIIPLAAIGVTAAGNEEVKKELKKIAFKTRTKVAETKQKVCDFFNKKKAKEEESE